MKIQQALVVPSWGGFFNEDLAAVKSGSAVRDGFAYLGQPMTRGFKQIRTPTEAASIVLMLDDGQVVSGDCLSVQYAGASGRSPRFNHETQIPALQQVCDYLIGQTIGPFVSMCERLELQPFDDSLNRTAAFYGVSQALLLATAALSKCTAAEVLAHACGQPMSESQIAIYVQCGEDRLHGVDKAIIHRADALPHGLINHVDLLGDRGEKVRDYVKWIMTRLAKFGSADYAPEIHLDLYGLLGQIFDHDADRIADYIAEVADCVKPLQFCMETPVLMDSRGGQIEMFADIRRALERRGCSAQLIVDEWANDLNDIRAFVSAKAAHMVNVKSPDLGSLHHAARAILECRDGNVRPILGGSCNDSDQSGRVMCHVALATQPAWILARPGMGMDEGFQIVHNEMARTLAVVAVRRREVAPV